MEHKVPRVLAVFKPLKCVIENLSDDTPSIVQALNFPNLVDSSTRSIKVGRIIYIEQDDFRLIDSSNKIVRLKYFGLVKCVDYLQNETGKILELRLNLVENSPKKVRGTINWVSEIDHVVGEIRQYDHIFPETLFENENWLSQINLETLQTSSIWIDSSILQYRAYDKVQFERIGYFCVDPDSSEVLPILNFTVKLKEDKMKN